MSLDRVWTVPNVISAVRLVISIACFIAIERGAWGWAIGLFLGAASTDWIDGWWARRFGQISRLGRIFDPLVDKVLICGAWGLLAARGGASAIAPWMAVVVVVRELVVTAVRAEMERTGHDFSAGLSGKLKMVLQCAAVALELAARQWPDAAPAGVGLPAAASVATWAAVVTTAWSGVEYLAKAAAMTSRPRG